MNNKLNKKKKKNNYSNMEIDDCNEDYNIYYDENNYHLNKQLNEDFKINKEEEIINVEFLFSEIRETYFFGIKSLLEGMLDFNEFNSSDLTEIILKEKDFIGNVIKTELEEESKIELPDLYAIGTIIPFYAYNNISLIQILKFIKHYCNISYKNNVINDNQYKLVENLLINAFNNDQKPIRLGLLINERVSNLPQQLAGPLLDAIRDDIKNYKITNDNYPKYDFSHIIYITKYVLKKNNKFTNNNGKKIISSNNKEEVLYYKFDDEYIIKNSDVVITYKVPYEEKNLDNIENTNEPVYKAIAIITTENFNKSINYILNNIN